jgi:hypothetical protein
MQTIILGHRETELVRLQGHLKAEGVDCRIQPVRNSLDIKNVLGNPDNAGLLAAVFYKLDFSPSEAADHLKRLDCFFVLENPAQMEMYRFSDCDFFYRFYFLPLNSGVLSDDIKSISLIKNYRHKFIDCISMDFVDLGQIKIDLNRRTVCNDSKQVFLKNKEFELLLYLSKNRGKLLSRTNLLEYVWDMNSSISTNTVDVHISKLRKILKANFGICSLIKTIPCSGYILL